MANSYHPTRRMIRALFAENGFVEPVPIEQLRTGGLVFTREGPDGGLQTAYVFTWSNFRVAAESGEQPCTLCVRVFFQTDRPLDAAIRNAQNGTDLGIHFSPGRWEEVCNIFATRVRPLFDLEAGVAFEALHDLGELVA